MAHRLVSIHLTQGGDMALWAFKSHVNAVSPRTHGEHEALCQWRASSNTLEEKNVKIRATTQQTALALATWWKNAVCISFPSASACARVSVQVCKYVLLPVEWTSRFARQARAVAFTAAARLEVRASVSRCDWWCRLVVTATERAPLTSGRGRLKLLEQCSPQTVPWYDRTSGAQCFFSQSYRPCDISLTSRRPLLIMVIFALLDTLYPCSGMSGCLRCTFMTAATQSASAHVDEMHKPGLLASRASKDTDYLAD